MRSRGWWWSRGRLVRRGAGRPAALLGRPILEVLEDRLAPSVTALKVVNDTAHAAGYIAAPSQFDLYQVHRPRTDTDIEETLSALSDLVHQGKVRYIGSSTFPASQIVEAQWIARDRRLRRFITEQPPYSILVRQAEADVLPTCARHGMGVLTYSPLAGGWLSGRWRKEKGQQESSRANRLPERFELSQPGNQRKLDAVEQLAKLAEETGITLIELAIAFVLCHPAITSAIIGPRTIEQLESQLPAADIDLDETVLHQIDEIVAPGITVNPVDNSFQNPALEPTARRR